jgi:hypothetical protein
MSIETLLEEYYKFKETQKDISDSLSELKDKILDKLDDNDVDIIKTNKYTVERKMITSYRISKSDLPSDIYDTYSKPCTSSTLMVYETPINGEKKIRRRSRSRSRNRLRNRSRR